MQELTRQQRRIVVLAMMTSLTSVMANSLLSPVIPDVLNTFGRPDRDAGFLVAASSVPGVVVAPVIGILADRLGRRAVLAPCLLSFGIAGAFVATAPTFELMLVCRLLMGFGGAGLVNLSIVLLSDTFTGTARTKWIGVNAGALTAALAAFPLLSGVLTEFVGWRWALAPYTVAVIGAATAWRLLEPNRPAHVPTVRDQLHGAVGALRIPVVGTAVIAGALMFAIMFGVFLTILPGHLEAGFGLSPAVRGLVIGLPSAMASITAFNLGRIRSRFSAGTVLIGTAAMWVLAFTLIGVAAVLPLLIVGTLIYGVGEGALLPTMQETALDGAPDGHRASVMAAWTALARLGQTVGPLGAALVLSAWGTRAALLGGSVGAAMLLVLFVVGPTRTRRAGSGSVAGSGAGLAATPATAFSIDTGESAE
ncbi:MAG TPA: MFS transporter [Ilumatobacter sp.]|nr:MFS transporter [Ilumatobacter sp.]